MGNLYSVLGLSSRASERQIKAAYRKLAKRSHPDVNAGDEAAEQRIKDINRVYEVLGDPEARAAYDSELARQRAEDRWRFWRSAATGAATFVVTVGIVSAAALWRQHVPAPPSQTRTAPAIASHQSTIAKAIARSDAAMAGLKEVQDKTPAQVALASPPADTARAREPPVPAQDASSRAEMASTDLPGRATEARGPSPEQPAPHAAAIAPVPVPPSVGAAASWTTYRDAPIGFALKYPGDVFVPDTGSGDNARTFVSRDGRALLRISASTTVAGMTVAKHRRALMEQRYSGATYDYTPQRSHWFVLSGTHGEEMFYERVTFSCDGRSVHGWQLTYPLAERAFYDRIIEEMHRGYRHGNGPGARCYEGKRETVSPPMAPIRF